MSLTGSTHSSKKEKEKKISIQRTETSTRMRIYWENNSEFLLCCLGAVVGLGDFNSFTKFVYFYGGGAFILTYLVCILCITIPSVFLKCGVGQYVGNGITRCFSFCPLLRNVWMISFLVEFFIMSNYAVLASYALRYFFTSFQSSLPWTKCNKKFSSKTCMDYLKPINFTECKRTPNFEAYPNGTCYDIITGELQGIWNRSLQRENGITPVLPAEDYFRKELQGEYPGISILNIGYPKWDTSLSMIGIWTLLYLSVIKDIRTTAKVIYFTATFPYFALVAFLIHGLTRKGGVNGMIFFFKINWSFLETPKNIRTMWIMAFGQSLFTMKIPYNVLIYMSAHCRFSAPILRNILIVQLCDITCSILSGIVTFSYLGAFAEELEGTIPDIIRSSKSEIGFVAIPQALSHLGPIWCLLYFMMVLTLCYDSILSMYVSVTSCIKEFFGIQGYEHGVIMKAITVIIMILFSLIQTTPGGTYVLRFINFNTAVFSTILLILIPSVAITIYGPIRICKDFEAMVGERPLFNIPWKFLQWFFIVSWMAIIPLSLILLYFSVKWYDDQVRDWYYNPAGSYPIWLLTLGVFMSLSPIIPFLISIIWDLCKRKGSMKDRFIDLIKPSVHWKPAITTTFDEACQRSFSVDNFDETEEAYHSDFFSKRTLSQEAAADSFSFSNEADCHFQRVSSLGLPMITDENEDTNREEKRLKRKRTPSERAKRLREKRAKILETDLLEKNNEEEEEKDSSGTATDDQSEPNP